MPTDYGLRLENPSGIIIIDSRYQNHTYHENGSLSVSKGHSYANIVNESTVPLIAIQPVTGIFANVHGLTKVGSNYTQARISASGSGTIPWLSYRPGLRTTQPNPFYGIQVKNSSGNVVYSSHELKYFKILAVYSYDVPDLSSSDDTDTTVKTVRNADDNYFMMTGGAVGLRLPDNTNRHDYFLGMKKTNSTTITIGWLNYRSTTWSGGAGASGSALESVSPAWLIEIEPPNI